jgi:hypothetical protein
MSDLQRRLIGPPDEFMRRTDLHYTMEVARDFVSAGEFDDYGEDEFEDDEDVDEIGAEEEGRFAELRDSIERMRVRAHEAIEKWLTEEARTPHPRLMDAVGVALAASIVETAGAGRMPEADRERMLSDLMADKDDPPAVAEALEQVIEYMRRFPAPERLLENFASAER